MGLLLESLTGSPIGLVGLISVFVALLYVFRGTFNKSQDNIALKSEQSVRSQAVDKNRVYGQWTPSSFKAPIPKPYENWSIDTTKPLMYRPFKHNYFVTMGHRSMEWDDWIELDNEWPKYHQRKLDRLSQDNAEELYGLDPIAVPAVEELIECLAEYLPNRYPNMFKRTAEGLWNLHTGECFDLETRPWTENPIVICAKLLQDDIAIMIEGKDGQYYLKAGAILLAGFWRLKDKLHMPLSEIHTSANVPEYKEKLKNSMERFFIRMRPDKPIVRNNYFIQTDDDLAWSHAIGNENSDQIGWYTAEVAKRVDSLRFRSERQSLRRLPRTGAIVFTIRTYFVPVTEICQEPYVPGRLLDGINSWGADVAEYKGLDKYKDVLIEYLKRKKDEQEKNGYSVQSETLNYPY